MVQDFHIDSEVHAALALGEGEDGMQRLGLRRVRRVETRGRRDEHCGYEARHGCATEDLGLINWLVVRAI